jgi:Flp pilus assembly pilin Flp
MDPCRGEAAVPSVDAVCRIAPTFGRVMIIRAVVRIVIDDRGQDLVEYALLSGIIGMAGILVFPSIAVKMSAAYTSWQSGVDAVWRPPCPVSAPCP